jgi:hypothetical protein
MTAAWSEEHLVAWVAVWIDRLRGATAAARALLGKSATTLRILLRFQIPDVLLLCVFIFFTHFL